MDDLEKIQTIKKIRDYRVTKKRKLVRQSEWGLMSIEQDLEYLRNEVSIHSKKFDSEKKERLKELFERKAQVSQFFDLQRKEKNHFKYLKKANEKKSNLEDGMYEKKNELNIKKKDLWVAEKSLIKIEEFIKLGTE